MATAVISASIISLPDCREEPALSEVELGGRKADGWGFWHSPHLIQISEQDSEHMLRDAEALDTIETGRGSVIVRCYGWHGKCVTVGRLQNEADAALEFGDWPMYRRPTGGKAILHGDDLVVSVAAKIGTGRAEELGDGSALIKRGVLSDYFCVTEPIRQALADVSIISEYGKDAVQCNRESNKAIVDCFKTNALCDITEKRTGKKIVGSAMRRGKQGFLVQTSIKAQNGFDPKSNYFLQSLQIHLARYLKVEHWDFPAR